MDHAPLGYEHRDEPGMLGFVARWWLARRRARVRAALRRRR
ncbi:hypothetical protein [Marmoricola sp. Leaf446]|nr:hypothetical protein [Marmoricola sp. Leaf446]